MKKIVKKGNLQTRRRIRKTVASLFMATAIVVASLPVENTGKSTLAATSGKEPIDLDKVYEDYLEYYTDAANYGNYFFGDNDTSDWIKYDKKEYRDKIGYTKPDLTVVPPDTSLKVTATISDQGSLEWTYLYKDKKLPNNDYVGIIVGYNSTRVTGNIAIESKAYDDAWIITNGLLAAFKKGLSGESYQYSITKESAGSYTNKWESKDKTDVVYLPGSISISMPTVKNGVSGANLDLTAQKDGGIYDSIGGTATLYKTWYGDDVVFKIEQMDSTAAVKYCENTSKYTTWKGIIDQYNEGLRTLTAEMTEADTSTGFSTRISELTNLYTESIAATMEILITDIERTTDYYDYVCDRLSINRTSKEPIYLSDFTLEKVVDKIHYNSVSSGNIDSFVPVYDETVTDAVKKKYVLDDNDYLMTGSITLGGVGNSVFEKDTKIADIELADSLSFIGNKAFAGTGCGSVTMTNTSIIGNQAFMGCSNLSSVTLFKDTNGTITSGVQYIGAQAFDKTVLKELYIPRSVTDILPGAFANSKLEKIDFGISADIQVWPFAFYNNTELGNNNGNVIFPSDYANTIKIGLGAFALADNKGGGKLTDFKFPYMKQMTWGKDVFDKETKSPIKSFYDTVSTKYKLGNNYNVVPSTDNEFMYNYILAGRSGLEHVTFPGSLGGSMSPTSGDFARIPDDTFYGCQNLKYVTLGSCDKDTNKNRDCVGIVYDTPGTQPDGTTKNDLDDDGHTLFQDIVNDTFYVEGPGWYATDYKYKSKPRLTTYYAQTAASTYVPYKYYKEDKPFMEVSNGKYITMFEVTDDVNKKATLLGYDVTDQLDTSNLGEIVIENEVCGYTITALAENCFDKIKNRVQELKIKDGCFFEIEDEAFMDCKDLRIVKIGNAVTSIGKNAFKGCEKLENVYFNKPINVSDNSSMEDWEAALTIANDAFDTTSDFLTFHGPIHSGYAPFEYAMNNDNTVKSGGRNICYRTDEPTNFTVIYNRADGLATLIDYPHYEDVDLINPDLLKLQQDTYPGITNYSILSDWENAYGINTNSSYNVTATSTAVSDAVEATILMNVPDGVDSINVSSFLKASENAFNKDYLTRYYYNNTKDDKYKINEIYYNEKGLQDTLYQLRNVNLNNTYKDIKDLYSKDDYYIYASTDNYYLYYNHADTTDRSLAGLFSPYLVDKDAQNSTAVINGADGTITKTPTNKVGLIGHPLTFNKTPKVSTDNMVEDLETGNDDLLSISFSSLKDLPDYAFFSCENLQRVDLGAQFGAPNEDGKYPDTVIMPFAACPNLSIITFDGKSYNDYYKFENGILYRIGQGTDKDGIEEGKYEIVEVLEARGNTSLPATVLAHEGNANINNTTISTLNDPSLKNVVSIAPGAFRNNKNIMDADLSDTSVPKLPKYCFYNDSKLYTVILPNSLETIEEYAFIGSTDGKHIYFNTPNVLIDEKAFDKNSGATFYGDAYSDSNHDKASTIKKYSDKYEYINFYAVSSYLVKLYNYNSELLDVRSIQVNDGDTVGGSIYDSELLTLQNKYCIREGYTFDGWAWDKDANLETTDDVETDQTKVLTNILEDRVLIAQYTPNTVISDGKTYTLTVIDGTIYRSGRTTGEYLGGTAVSVTADNKEKLRFAYWTVEPEDSIPLDKYDAISTKLSFVMPNANVTLKVNYIDDTNGDIISPDNPSGGGGNGGNNGDNGDNGNNGDNTDTKTTYDLTVNYGSGSGKYEAGAVVTITAFAPESPKKVFSKWTAGSGNIAFANSTSATTTIVMPASSETVTANYKTRTNDDDDDDSDAIKRRQDNSIGNGGVTTTINTSTGTTPTNTTNTVTNNGGDKLYINKNGVSNKDVGTASVEGSTDNFIVRITDSDEATAAVQDALRNRFGNLDGIVYFPMDISLYDSTGTHKIMDTYGLNVNVTMPIPDSLIKYGGNVQVAAADNGYLQNLNQKFTTIDGIACTTFTPPHFSPYVLYVDTNNLIAGLTYDKTPQTGDPIHPKWFLAMGFACMSIFLFVKGDKKKKIPVRA